MQREMLEPPQLQEASHPIDWTEKVYQLLKQYHIDMVSFVPDAPQKPLIERCQQDKDLLTLPLTSEEQGVALCAGAFLGGRRAVLLMQSSGVGNCINLLTLPRVCHMPLLTLVTMRGEWAEFNPWQIPMGQNTPTMLEACGMIVHRVSQLEEVSSTVEAAIKLAFQCSSQVAVLFSQQLLGTKRF